MGLEPFNPFVLDASRAIIRLKDGSVRFEWDEQKRQLNLEKHGLDFGDVRQLFEAPMLEALDTRHNYGEDRWVAIGSLQGRVVVVVFTQPHEATVRIISLRKAVKSERDRYEKTLQKRLG